jgi:hypothetical protein
MTIFTAKAQRDKEAEGTLYFVSLHLCRFAVKNLLARKSGGTRFGADTDFDVCLRGEYPESSSASNSSNRYKMNHTGKALLYGFVPLWL